MTDSILRRQFLWWVIGGLGVTFPGRSPARAASAPADSPPRRTPSGDLLETVPKGALPSFAREGGSKVQEAYRFAAENGEILQYMPCFCGCKNIGHRHNADCYVAERLPGGSITFNSHAAT